MKLRKRLVSLVLAFGMLAACLPTAFAEENPPQQNLTQSDQKAAAPTEGTCGEKVTWKLAGGTLTISGAGDMKDYADSTVPWKDSRDAITKVVVESGVTTVGDNAFYGCKNLTQVSLPAGLTCIGDSAFDGASSLTEIKIPDSVNEIKASAFRSCSSISSVDIPDGVTIINDSTFYGCSNLRNVTIPDSVVTISGSAFRDCTALSGISIPNSVVNIGSFAFKDCKSLKEVEIPDSVRNIYTNAFADCINLQKIRLSEQLSVINSEVFRGCSSLKEVTVPDNATAIKSSAFKSCTRLEKITFGSSVNSIAGQSNASYSPFYGCDNLSEIYFTGDAPHFEDWAFATVTATAYYPRNASGWEDVIQNQYHGTITWTPWTPGETPEPPATRQFQIDRDAWGFTNSTSTFGDAKEGYYITQADYDRLVSLLPNTEREDILTAVETKKIPLSNVKIQQCESTYNIDGKTLVHMKWGGSCHGMSVWACLTKDGVRKIAELGSAAENLHSVAFSPKVESAINYYHMQQCLQNTVLATNRFKSLPQNEQLKQLENQVSDNQVVLVSFNWCTKFDKDGKPKKNSSAAHTVVGYGVESGTWNKTVNDRTDTYTHRILIYDCNRGEYDEEYDLYYNDSGLWCIPAYNIRSASNEINGMGDNGCLNLVSNDKKVLNAVDYAPNSTEPNTGYAPVVLATSSDNTYSVNWGSGSADIDGIIASNVSGTERVNVIMEANVTEDGTSEECRASAVLPNAKEYTIKSSEDGMSYQLKNENYLTVAASEKSGTMKIQADGGAKIDTQEAGDYYISMTANEGYYELPWSTVEVAGEDCKQISADMTDEGIVVSGDNLKDITIIGKKDEQTKEVTVSTDKSDVLISSDNGDISVKQDSDGDGKYETDIVKPNPEPKPTTPVTEIFSDIYPSAWYIDYVQFVYDNGLMTGTSKTTFAPEVTLSRAMVAQVLYNYDKRVDSPYRATNGKTFKDVSKNDWFYEAIQWASANGIASGVGNGYFEPNSPVTREQVAQFLYNYNGRPSVSGNLPFSDADKVSGWAKNAMLWAYQNKIINGTTSPDGGLLLDPQGGATRAQAAAILTNYMKNMM
ncbi:MAG: leucine-rich repeat protein [Eubacteriales bacterium]|nr:leucine-rich repeat protein [Eubacteriales bacterium]